MSRARMLGAAGAALGFSIVAAQAADLSVNSATPRHAGDTGICRLVSARQRRHD